MAESAYTEAVTRALDFLREKGFAIQKAEIHGLYQVGSLGELTSGQVLSLAKELAVQSSKERRALFGRE